MTTADQYLFSPRLWNLLPLREDAHDHADAIGWDQIPVFIGLNRRRRNAERAGSVNLQKSASGTPAGELCTRAIQPL